MLLMSQYLQGTHRSTTTWNIHGLAVKAAFQLGLHTTCSSSHMSLLDREMRLRTWYGCIILDRYEHDFTFITSAICSQIKLEEMIYLFFRNNVKKAKNLLLEL